MKNIFLIVAFSIVSNFVFCQITHKQLAGTWSLAAIHAHNDPTFDSLLIITYDKKINYHKYFPHYYINYIDDLTDSTKILYPSSTAKEQLLDFMNQNYLQGLKHQFIEFNSDSLYKSNNATDSTFTTEAASVGDTNIVNSAKEMFPYLTYQVSNDSLILNFAVDKIFSLYMYPKLKLTNEFLIVETYSIRYYFRRLSEQVVFLPIGSY